MDKPPSLTPSSGPLAEELQCSVCLDVFTNPVSTPCGHNFCKRCLNQCWNNSQNCYCPFCKETFSKRPDLKINTALRQVVQLFEEKFSLMKFEVLCDICNDVKLKALKSCLVCQTSYCETHLEPHLRVLSLKKHKLMDPVENIKDYICQKHERPLELFCRDDQTYVCVFCTDGDHKTHNTVHLEEESKNKKAQLVKTQKDMQQMMQDRIRKIQDIKHSAELRKKSTEQKKAASVKLFSDLIRSIKRCQAELLEMMEEKQKAAEKQDEELIQELQQEISELKMRDTELDHLLHTEDHLQLLQIDPSLCSPPHTRNWPEISMNTDVSVEALRRALTQLQETLDQKLNESGKSVSNSKARYYYISTKNRTDWNLGVARESINRKGLITMCPQNGLWAVALRNGNEYWACAGPSVCLSLRVKPQNVGVFVDYEEGLVSFYDVESRSHIYSFTGQSFTDNPYPLFSPELNNGGKNSAPLISSHDVYNK
uniref:E3 ubiquitin-protein ligase TRIM39-like n=1 Tax=Cyprinus carpio TaxID=7962 RepID=A0A8C2I514_CYPCA